LIGYANTNIEMPYIIEKKGRIIASNLAFLELSGFSFGEILDIQFNIVWNELLRIDLRPEYLDTEVYLFTKHLEARCVLIQIQENLKADENKYIFKEIPNSRFEDKNQFAAKLIAENDRGVGIYTAPNFILLKANQTYLDYLPKPFNTKELVYGKCLKDFVPGFEGSHGDKIWQDVVATNKSYYSKETKRQLLGDDYRYWDNAITPIAENGQVKYIVSILDDVTERVLSRKHITEQAEIVKQQKEELDVVIDNISEGLAIIDKYGNYVKVNKKAKEYASLSTNIGKTVAKVGDSLALGEKYYDKNGNILSVEEFPGTKVINGSKVESQIIVLRRGNKSTYFEYNANPILDDKGELRLGVILSRNITEQIEKDELIKSQKEQLETILNNMSDAIYIVDKNREFVLINAEARRKVFGNNIVNDFNTLYHSMKAFDMDGNEIPFHMLPTLRTLKGETIENYRLKIKGHASVWIADVNTTPIYNENNEMSMAVMCLRDITQQVKLQNEKDEALEASMKLKDEFLYLITHEFKTPITVIHAALQTIDLIYKSELTEKLNRFLSTIKQNTNRQLRLVNNLLDITRISSGHLKLNVTDINIVYITRAIVNSVALFANQKGIELSFHTNLTENIISLDEQKYERILLNLLSNALKFTPQGKLIDVSLSIKKYRNKNNICVSIKDEGIGIPQNKQEHIFQRFGQVDRSLSRQAEGTGLGLYLTKLLVNALHGVITLESEEGKGSTFTVLLPITRVEALEETALYHEAENQYMNSDSRIVEATAIEFSDIYF